MQKYPYKKDPGKFNVTLDLGDKKLTKLRKKAFKNK